MFSIGAIFYKLLFDKNLFPGTKFDVVLKLNKQCEINYQEILNSNIMPE